MLQRLFFPKKNISSVTECESLNYRERTLKKGAVQEKHKPQGIWRGPRPSSAPRILLKKLG